MPPTPLLVMGDGALQVVVFTGWTFAVPALAGGFFWEAPSLRGSGGWALLVAIVIATLDHELVLSHVGAQVGRLLRKGNAPQALPVRTTGA